VASLLVALLVILPSPVEGGAANPNKAACLARTSCMLPAVWEEWGQKFNASVFTQPDGGWSQALTLYLNASKVNHWLDEYHEQAGCCEFWRCNNVTLRCQPPQDVSAAHRPSAAAFGAALTAVLAAAALAM